LQGTPAEVSAQDFQVAFESCIRAESGDLSISDKDGGLEIVRFVERRQVLERLAVVGEGFRAFSLELDDERGADAAGVGGITDPARDGATLPRSVTVANAQVRDFDPLDLASGGFAFVPFPDDSLPAIPISSYEPRSLEQGGQRTGRPVR
jgi:hypothetical protein